MVPGAVARMRPRVGRSKPGSRGSGPRAARGSTSSGWRTTQRARRFSVPISVTSKPGEGAKSSAAKPTRRAMGERLGRALVAGRSSHHLTQPPRARWMTSQRPSRSRQRNLPRRVQAVTRRPLRASRGGSKVFRAAMAPSSQRSTSRPRAWLVEELDQGLDLGKLGHRPMMPPLFSGRGTGGRGGDGTVGAVELRRPEERPPATGRPRRHGVGAGGGRLRDDGSVAAGGVEQNDPGADLDRGDDQHDHARPTPPGPWRRWPGRTAGTISSAGR